MLCFSDFFAFLKENQPVWQLSHDKYVKWKIQFLTCGATHFDSFLNQKLYGEDLL